ncbi:MAG TPA: nucleoside-diphosphate sugar epimerase, partial [Hyphomonadaceae bacterium]|nr:nucleoside-diphosphate sugar epimerase [Hyphomonadaceae bacterium]
MLTRRSESLLAKDTAANADRLTQALAGKSCLVIGGAGSIGSETTLLLAQFPLSRLTIIDQDENGLARLVRRLRGNALAPPPPPIDPLPIGFGAP